MTKHNKKIPLKTLDPTITKKKPHYLKKINPYTAGIDIGSRSHFVAAPVCHNASGDMEIEIRYELLESKGFEVNLVDARHVKNVTGR